MGRCTAKSKRSGKQCKNWAMRKKATCRFHGGHSSGPKTKAGKAIIGKVHYKHGCRSKAAQEQRKKTRALIKDSMNFLCSFER